MQDVKYELAPDATILPGEGGKVRAVVGDGITRQDFELEGGALVRFLLRAVQGRTFSELIEDVESQLDLGHMAAVDLVESLVATGLLTTGAAADQTRQRGRRWEEWGWRDAFDFHFASHRLPFDKTSDPDIYDSILRTFLANQDETGPQPPPSRPVRGTHNVSAPPGAETPESPIGAVLARNTPTNFFTSASPVTLVELHTILSSAAGVQKTFTTLLGEHYLKPVPSGGARHPIELYVIARTIDGLAPGAYYFDAKCRKLAQIDDQQAVEGLDAVGFGKRGIATACGAIIATVRWIRHSWKYRYPRSFRMALIDAGHMAQMLRLAATAIGVDTCYAPAVDDELAEGVLKIEDRGDESAVFILGLGKGGRMS